MYLSIVSSWTGISQVILKNIPRSASVGQLSNLRGGLINQLVNYHCRCHCCCYCHCFCHCCCNCRCQCCCCRCCSRCRCHCHCHCHCHCRCLFIIILILSIARYACSGLESGEGGTVYADPFSSYTRQYQGRGTFILLHT